MKAVVVMIALWACFAWSRWTWADDDEDAPVAPPRAATGKSDGASVRGAAPKGTAAEPDVEDDDADVAPQPEEKLYDPYARDPYDSDASPAETGTAGAATPDLFAPPADATRGLADPYDTDSAPDTDPYAGDE